MTPGLQRGIVSLVSHSEEWDRLFEEEKSRIVTCLQGKTFDIEHVGSTAIPGVPAKPIIDIAVGVSDVEAIGEYFKLLGQIGYEYRGDRAGDGDHTFAKGAESRRTHYLHVVAMGSTKWYDYVLFRDYLRRHGETRREYAALKRSIAEGHPSDRKSYGCVSNELGKTSEVSKVLYPAAFEAISSRSCLQNPRLKTSEV
jgi:GrpB-like predicted nucleotidyltransferase (UPF0157 family)